MPLLVLCSVAYSQAPQAVLKNGVLEATVMLPDGATGSYRGSRFDWSGVIASLRFGKHEYFGRWYEKHDPLHHDAITGPVEEFLHGEEALGFSEAPVGGNFVRIGIGALRKESDAKFQRFGRYKLVTPGTWKVSTKAGQVRFRHDLKDAVSGYGYRYEKTLTLVPGKPELLIEHALRNTGKKTIDSSSYNHNFFVIDGSPSGPDLSVEFGFAAQAKAQIAPLAALESNKLRYQTELKPGQSVFTEIQGFGPSANDYSFRVENAKSGAGVRITGDQPLSKVVFWSIRSVMAPEPYVTMSIAPGETYRWKIRYEFYEREPGK